MRSPGSSAQPTGARPSRAPGSSASSREGCRARFSDKALATLLFVDVADSTAIAATRGDAAWRDLLDLHDAGVAPNLAAYQGIEIDRAGGGLLATFNGPTRAIRAAAAIRAADRRLGVETRSGIHTGEIERTPHSVRGLAVHVAARIAAMAGPGDILVSATVRDLVAGSGIELASRGRRRLKGVPDRVPVYVVSALAG